MGKNMLCLPGLRQNNLFHMVSLQKLSFLISFETFLHESYMVSLHKRVPRGGRMPCTL